LDIASRFYGLEVRNVAVGDKKDIFQLMEELRREETLALIITSDALYELDRSKIFAALRGSGTRRTPVLVVSDATEKQSAIYAEWSDRAVTGCNPPVHDSSSWNLRIADHKDVAQQLAGRELPFQGNVVCTLDLGRSSAARILAVLSNRVEQLPAFVDTLVSGHHVFFAASLVSSYSAVSSVQDRLVATFSSIAPLMMFLRHVAGARAWHTIAPYANLMIDDAWLIEPYGNLDYNGLLAEMEKHRFHATIAFTPWNFDRSHPDVVSLFRVHPERFSIAIHGNNHEHQEFQALEPLGKQVFNIKQALARMEDFKRRTGLSYDPVMVFPQAVGGVESFRLLKTYGYWATVNAQNVPEGSAPPTDPLFALRPGTLRFANFLNLRRHSAEKSPLSPEAIAVSLYVGDPLLLYVHQGFFQTGIGAFDEITDLVHRIEPNTEWKSLGYITQHLYHLRLRLDQSYDVLALSPVFDLANPGEQAVVFHVRKPENFDPPLRSLTIDGNLASYEASRDEIAFDLRLLPKETKHVEIRYVNDLDVARIDISKKNLRVKVLRQISDFRDLFLSRNALGRTITDYYYGSRLHLLEETAERNAPLLLSVIVLLVAIRLLYSRTSARRDSAKSSAPRSIE
jgi:hypothetical protein